MKRKKTVKKLRKALILLNAEVDREQDEQMKMYLRGVATGFTMAISRIDGTYNKISVFEEVTKNPKILAEFILSKPCMRITDKSCEDGASCIDCMMNYLTKESDKPHVY